MILPADCEVAELPFFQNCMLGICEVASARDYDVLAVYTRTGETGDLERIISNHKIDGVILSRTLVEDTAADYIKRKQVPLVAVGSSPDKMLIQVDHDHKNACRELTLSLMQKGLRRLGLIGGNMSHMVSRSRYEGFAEAFCEMGRPVNADMVYLGNEDMESIRQAVEKLRVQQAECIVCMDDMICNHVLRYLEEQRINVPEQVEIASFYAGITIENTIHPVTTLEFDAKKLGHVTCNTLLDVIEGKQVAEKQLLPYTVKPA